MTREDRVRGMNETQLVLFRAMEAAVEDARVNLPYYPRPTCLRGHHAERIGHLWGSGTRPGGGSIRSRRQLKFLRLPHPEFANRRRPSN